MPEYRKIICPLFNEEPARKCNGNPIIGEPFDPCPDCPIDWSKVQEITAQKTIDDDLRATREEYLDRDDVV